MGDAMGEWGRDGDDGGDAAPPMESYMVRGEGEGCGGEPREWGGEEESDEEGGMGLMEAFESFNMRATRRVQELLVAADARLYGDGEAELADEDEPPPDTPSYVLMSDNYRLARPPQFRFWRQSFPYLQLTGKSSFDEAPDEHIQIRPPPSSASTETYDQCTDWDGGGGMEAVGTAFHLQIDTSDPPQEELIIADGEMEEVLEEDHENSEPDIVHPPCGALLCPSPRTTRVEEEIDRVTIDCYSTFIPPAIGAVLRSILERQQQDLRVARENHEEAVRLIHEAEIAHREELRRRAEKEAQDKALYEAAVANALEEDRAREEERREELLRQQREENDEEEIKIRTLAYTHTREWYQPNKNCFSHRGRQLSYLKPVRKAQADQDDQGQEGSQDKETTTRESLMPSKPTARKMRQPRRVSSPSVADVMHAKVQQRSPKVSPPSVSRPSSSRSQNSDRLPSTDQRVQVVLPMLTHVKLSFKDKSSTWKEERASQPTSVTKLSSTTVPPTRVYSTSPYRIPPPILKTELPGDTIVTGRKGTKRHKGETR